MNKMEHIIKKLNLKKNQKVLDIGSGWGTLAIEIAKRSECEVLGITLSENQLKYSIQKAKELNNSGVRVLIEVIAKVEEKRSRF